MAELDAFERVFRAEVQKRKDRGDNAPSWSDVKRLVKEYGLFDKDKMEDPDFKARLKETATELAMAIMTVESDGDAPITTKKRKSASTRDEPEERPTKRVKQTASKASKKQAKIEEDFEDEPNEKPAKKVASRKESTKKSKQKIDDSDEEEEEKVPAKKAHKAIPPKSPEMSHVAPVEEKRIPAADVAEMSDSALSIVVDDSPKKAKTVKKEKKKAEPKPSKGAQKGKESKEKSKGNTPGDADEEQIKRLKSFVVACGVRKKWAKEFEGMEDKPKKQITRLKEILADLGMSGRLSMEKAKAIRARRELAEELEEVVQFEKHRGMPKDEDGTKTRRKQRDSPPENASEDEEQLAANPPQRRKNILAFLDDQSEEE